jgi:hypothetical protein
MSTTFSRAPASNASRNAGCATLWRAVVISAAIAFLSEMDMEFGQTSAPFSRFAEHAKFR